ncbi:MAG: lytic transglycosylase domain-containing protein, partial [Flavobacteriaceae bacterium]
MNRSYRFIVITSIIIVAAFFINAENSVAKKSNSGDSAKDSSGSVDNNYRIKALKIPDNLSFAGEKVELDKTDIRERIDRELLVNTYWQSNALLWFKRTHKYFPVIEPILKEKGVPDDFKYLSVIESDLRNVTSPAGAKGMWQMLKDAGRENGL